jgi:hypothetical protein
VRLLSTPSATLLLRADAALLAAEDAAVRTPALALSAAPAGGAARPPPSVDSGLVFELIGLRRRIALELDVPPYTVFGEDLVLSRVYRLPCPLTSAHAPPHLPRDLRP